MSLQLRPLQPDDASALAKFANNRKIWNRVRDRMPFPYTQQHAHDFIGKVHENKYAFVQAIIWPNVGFIGTVGLHLKEAPYQGSAELAYWVGEPYWGQGITTEAVQQMVELGFTQKQVRRIYATVFAFNTGSIRVLEKNGFQKEVIARAAVLKNGERWDEITFGLLTEENRIPKEAVNYNATYPKPQLMMSTPKVTLRELRFSDAPSIAQLANNKKIWDNVRNRMPYPYRLADAENFIGQVLKEEHTAVRSITHEGIIKGLIGLHPADDVYTGTAELGYWIGEPYWGQGLASAAVQQMIHLGFKNLELRRIYASVYEHNLASMRVLEKNGFEREGVARAAVLKNGIVLDEVRFGLVPT